jgi:hypothetical protein
MSLPPNVTVTSACIGTDGRWNSVNAASLPRNGSARLPDRRDRPDHRSNEPGCHGFVHRELRESQWRRIMRRLLSRQPRLPARLE